MVHSLCTPGCICCACFRLPAGKHDRGAVSDRYAGADRAVGCFGNRLARTDSDHYPIQYFISDGFADFHPLGDSDRYNYADTLSHADLS